MGRSTVLKAAVLAAVAALFSVGPRPADCRPQKTEAVVATRRPSPLSGSPRRLLHCSDGSRSGCGRNLLQRDEREPNTDGDDIVDTPPGVATGPPPEGSEEALQLAWAVANGDFGTVLDLLNAGVDPNDAKIGGTPPLWRAAFRDDIEIVELLLDNGADINGQNRNDTTALYMASQGGFLTLVRFLLEAGADPEIKSIWGTTALMVASSMGRIAVVRELLDKGANTRVRSKQLKRSSVFLAALGGHTNAVDLLLEQAPNMTNVSDKRNTTPLYAASSRNHTSTVDTLLSFSANPDLQRLDGTTPLHTAAAQCFLEIVQMLLDAGASTEIISSRGNRAVDIICVGKPKDEPQRILVENALLPLIRAVRMENATAVELLIESGENVNQQIRDGRTPLHIAASIGTNNITRILLDSGANPNIKDEDGNTSLHVATSEGNTGVMRLLGNGGADVDAQNNNKQSALHLAGKNGDAQAVMVLKQFDPKPNIKDIDGNSSLHLATASGDNETVSAVLSLGANPNVRNRNQETPLYIAAELGLEDVIRTLLGSDANPNIVDINGLRPVDVIGTQRDLTPEEESRIRMLLENRGQDDGLPKTSPSEAGEPFLPFIDIVLSPEVELPEQGPSDIPLPGPSESGEAFQPQDISDPGDFQNGQNLSIASEADSPDDGLLEEAGSGSGTSGSETNPIVWVAIVFSAIVIVVFALFLLLMRKRSKDIRSKEVKVESAKVGAASARHTERMDRGIATSPAHHEAQLHTPAGMQSRALVPAPVRGRAATEIHRVKSMNQAAPSPEFENELGPLQISRISDAEEKRRAVLLRPWEALLSKDRGYLTHPDSTDSPRWSVSAQDSKKSGEPALSDVSTSLGGHSIGDDLTLPFPETHIDPPMEWVVITRSLARYRSSGSEVPVEVDRTFASKVYQNPDSLETRQSWSFTFGSRDGQARRIGDVKNQPSGLCDIGEAYYDARPTFYTPRALAAQRNYSKLKARWCDAHETLQSQDSQSSSDEYEDVDPPSPGNGDAQNFTRTRQAPLFHHANSPGGNVPVSSRTSYTADLDSPHPENTAPLPSTSTSKPTGNLRPRSLYSRIGFAAFSPSADLTDRVIPKENNPTQQPSLMYRSEQTLTRESQSEDRVDPEEVSEVNGGPVDGFRASRHSPVSRPIKVNVEVVETSSSSWNSLDVVI